MAKTPGAYRSTVLDTELLNVLFTGDPALVPLIVAPATATVTGAVPSPIPSSHGTSALICPGETKWIGAKKPLMMTVTPPREVGRAGVPAATVLWLKPEP